MEIRHVVTHEALDGSSRSGHREGRADENSPWERLLHSDWVQYRAPRWLAGHARDKLDAISIDTSALPKEKLQALSASMHAFEEASDADFASLHYLAVASQNGVGEEALKWVMGALSAELNARNLPFSAMRNILRATALNEFCRALLDGGFDRSFAKPIFAELLKGEKLADLVNDPRFKAADESVIDDALDAIIAANPDQFEKAKGEPKVIQWFVGQAMKATQGKAKPPVVIQKMQERLAVA